MIKFGKILVKANSAKFQHGTDSTNL